MDSGIRGRVRASGSSGRLLRLHGVRSAPRAVPGHPRFIPLESVVNHSPTVPSAARGARRAFGTLALSAAGLLAASVDAGAQVDFTVVRIEANQAVQYGSTALVEGRTTFVRAFVRALPTPTSPIPVDGLLRVYADGVEVADSPIFSDNGPFPAMGPDPSFEDGTLNFIFVPPNSANVVLTVEVNPAGPNQVAETNLTNNLSATNPLAFNELKVPELAYAPIDYRPGGEQDPPNLPDDFLIEPGTGDGFVQGIYPAKDWYYHRTDAPSKLWTASLSGSGSALISSLQADRLLMDPIPDYIYGWVPGGLPYNGQSTIGGPASMGNTERFRHQRTFAHEIGHNHGLSHNSIIANTWGIDTEHHLNITEGLSQFKPFNQNDIMVPGLFTPVAWVANNSYNFFLNHPTYQLPLELTTDDTPTLLVNGVWNKTTGTIEVHHVVEVPPHEKTAPVLGAAADFTLRSFSGGALVRELPVVATGVTDCAVGDTDSGVSSPEVNFYTVIPALAPNGARIDKLVFEQAGADAVATLELTRSAHAPEVSFADGVGGPIPGPVMTVAWNGVDVDGDAITYYLRYSNDGEGWTPLASGITATEWTVDLRELPGLVDGVGVFELRATDGLNTTVITSGPLTGGKQYAGVGGNDPWIEMYHPDPGFTFLKGGTVILHSSGWDLEDNGLDGASIQWTSDVDGALGSGRLTKTTGLTVGPHVITATATDSDGQTASVSVSITILDRDLPDVVGEICQADLGFGGPGSMELSICGGDLSSGTTADLFLTGGPANALSYAFVGFTADPTPVAGGQIVPVPPAAVKIFSTDANGEIFLPGIPGGGGPFSAYVQIVTEDGGQPFGYAISNTVQADFLP